MVDLKHSLIRKLKVRSSELRDELTFFNKIYKIAVEDFCQSVSIFCEHENIRNPLLDLTSDQKDKSPEDLTPQLKSLFRDIAKKTHSDLFKSDSRHNLLQEAVEAKKDNKSSNLLSIAKDLNISTSELDYKSIELIESSINKLEKEIHDITNSYPWLWYHANDKRKNDIIKEFVLSKV